jgi:hypothetical protein
MDQEFSKKRQQAASAAVPAITSLVPEIAGAKLRP